jgi:prepilin-type N-terminal cleavage/methylation domain-containing protein
MLKKAFTLVELLVVITIISMLVGLLLPAMQSVRGRARITQCTNNQHELALAIAQYDSAKRHLPGALNLVRGTTVGWVPVLFPYLGRNDLWKDNEGGMKGWRYGRDTSTADGDGISPTPRIPSLVCPDDNDTTVECPLSYVVNLGLYNVNVNNTFNQNGDTGLVEISGLFRNHAAGVTCPSLASVTSRAQTVMLGEKIITPVSAEGDYVPSTPTPSRQWTDQILGRLGFSWPNYPPQPLPAPQPTMPNSVLSNMLAGTFYVDPPGNVKYWSPLPSIHPGIVIVTFADGHTETVSSELECQVYRAIP